MSRCCLTPLYQYPDVVNLVSAMFASSPSLRSFIMDAEIVAIDPASGALKSFQELSGRARKDVDVKDIRVSVCVYAFDLMYLNGEVRMSCIVLPSILALTPCISLFSIKHSLTEEVFSGRISSPEERRMRRSSWRVSTLSRTVKVARAEQPLRNLC